MSSNIKLNAFNLAGNWNNLGLTAVRAGVPVSPSMQDIADEIVSYAMTVLYNAAMVSEADKIRSMEVVASTVNYLTADSWCVDCCDNTFSSYKVLKSKISTMGYSPTQLTYINQIIGMPCNVAIIAASDFKVILKQLETSVLIDTTLPEWEKGPVLTILAIASYSLDYWIDQADHGPWFDEMIPAPETAWIRPFWLSNILGAIVGTRIGITMAESQTEDLVILGMIGGITGAASYAFFK